MRGFNVALMQRDGKAGGKETKVIVGSADASPDSAVRAARKLVEQDEVDVLISPFPVPKASPFATMPKPSRR